MALNKQDIPLNFAHGLDQKTDPKQVQLGHFLALENSVFTKGGLLQKRNGFPAITSLPDSSSTFLTTFNDNLTAIGTNLYAYAAGSMTWGSKGSIQPLHMNTRSLIRAGTAQIQADTAIASNGLLCVVYTDATPGGNVRKYSIIDPVTGQVIVNPVAIPTGSGTTLGAPKVFALGSFFIIVIGMTVSGTPHLQYVAIPINNPNSTPIGPVDISSQYRPGSVFTFDGTVANNRLYLTWNGSDLGGAIRNAYLTSTLILSNTVITPGYSADSMSITADTSGVTPVVYTTFWSIGGSTIYTMTSDQNLVPTLAPTAVTSVMFITNITTQASSGLCTVLYEKVNAYSYDDTIPTHYVSKATCTSAGGVSGPSIVIRSLGLASKAATINGQIYALGVYQSPYQPTYFLFRADGTIVAKVAYSNGAGYLIAGLPNISVSANTITVPYLIKDLLQAANKTQGSATPGVYAQTGINIANFTLGTSEMTSAEIASNLHLSGGFIWAYDGVEPVEQGFHLWPDSVEATTSTTGGFITAGQYFYQVTYEWVDNQGNLQRSAPSVPISVTTTGTTSSNTLDIPTLRVTAKVRNPVNIVIYRWSAAQQTYYQVTSITSPLLNDTTVDSVTYVDTKLDGMILGNNILYTTGGTLENIGPPAANVITLFDNRLFLIPAEDENLLWFSKQVIEATPVEMSDLLTIYTAPTTSSQSSSGPTKCAAPMDDKLILFKKNTLYYIAGNGPDNTGSNNQYSPATIIHSPVGCDNPQSIVQIPQGLMFQSNNGIWLLDRSLGTSYIGSPVEDYVQAGTVLSAVAVQNTTQVRFTMDTGVTLMYDYYYGEWGVFTGIPAISSTMYAGLHTYVNSSGAVFQERPNTYLDGSTPVTVRFTTAWVSLAGLQGLERAYELFFLGTYLSPHKVSISIAYDYVDSNTQTTIITPTNFNPAYGNDSRYGSGSPYGGNSPIEQWRIFFERQKCQSFRVTFQEIFDASFGTAAGAGLTVSGLNMTVGYKKGRPTLRAASQAG